MLRIGAPTSVETSQRLVVTTQDAAHRCAHKCRDQSKTGGDHSGCCASVRSTSVETSQRLVVTTQDAAHRCAHKCRDQSKTGGDHSGCCASVRSQV